MSRSEMRIRPAVIEMRAALSKVVALISKQDIPVYQVGTNACVTYAGHKPLHVQIPVIPDSASDEFLEAIRGFVDHECGHLLFTDHEVGARYLATNPLYNAVEDVYVEAEMQKLFPGSRENLSKLHERMCREIFGPRCDELVAQGGFEESALFGRLFQCAFRAVAGQRVFAEFMERYWGWLPETRKVLERFAPRLRSIANSKEAGELADDLRKALFKEERPEPPQSAEKGDEGDQQQGGKDEADQQQKREKSENDEANAEAEEPDSTGESGESEPGDGQEEGSEVREEGGESDESADDEEGDSEEVGAGESEEPERGDDEEDESQPAKSDESEGDGEPEEGESAGSDDGDDENGATDDDSDDSDGGAEEDDSGKDDGDSDESDGSDEGDSDEGESDRDGDEESDADSDASSPNDGGADDDKGDGDIEAGEHEEEGKGEADAAPEEGGLIAAELPDGEADPDAPVPDTPPLSFNEAEGEMKDETALREYMMRALAEAEHQSAAYVPYTTRFDYIGPPKIPKKPTAACDLIQEKVTALTGPMRRHLIRAFTSMNKARWEGGKRMGKIDTRSLYRLRVEDDRIFRTKEITRTKETAVSLVVDLSGSMNGDKIVAAVQAAWALGETLEAINIPFEIVGFTTWFPERCRAELVDVFRHPAKSAVYSRFEPLYMPVFKSFQGRFDRKAKEGLTSYCTGNGKMASNVDGECVAIAAERLMAQPQPRKCLIVLSDGMPCAGMANGSVLAAHLKGVVKSIEGEGVSVVGIGIQTPHVDKFYRKHVVLHKVRDLPGEVIRKLSEAILAK